MTSVAVRTNAWYGDEELELAFPPGWDIVVHRPSTPAPLSVDDVERAFDQPIAQDRLRVVAAGCTRPVIVVDDVTRPTPASEVLPRLLRELEAAGIPSRAVTIVIGTGTHGPPTTDAIRKKIGGDVSDRYRVVVHDDRRDAVRIGRTTRGTPVFVNRDAAASDLVIGVGGVYPQHTVGFGGGVKTVLGVLGRTTIRSLHYGHEGMQGAYDIDNSFRRDLSEIAALVGMRTCVAVHVDADRRAVRVVTGDPRRLYRDAVAFSMDRYVAPPPGDADVVISNAYPMDVSLTFMRSKGILPLLEARPGASRIVIAACPEGTGHHGLFPFVDVPMFQRERHLARLVAAHPGRAVRGAARRARRIVSAAPTAAPAMPANGIATHPIHLVTPGQRLNPLPSSIPGMLRAGSWHAAIEAIQREQGDPAAARVVVYTAAPLQVLASELTGDVTAPAETAAP